MYWPIRKRKDNIPLIDRQKQSYDSVIELKQVIRLEQRKFPLFSFAQA